MEKENQDASKYKPEYATQLYEHMKKGKGISCFNVEPPVFQKTIFNWLKQHEDFLMAKERGRAAFMNLLESVSYYHVLGIPNPELVKLGSKKADGEHLRFLLKNKFREEYSEKTEIEHKGESIHKITVEVIRGDQA